MRLLVGCTVVGNSLLDNAPAGVRSDNASDETLVGNSIVNSDGAAGVLMVGGNHRAAVVGNTISGGVIDHAHPKTAAKAMYGVLVQSAAPPSDDTHTCVTLSSFFLYLAAPFLTGQLQMRGRYVPSTGVGLVDVCVRANVSPDGAVATKNGGVHVAGSRTQTPDDSAVFAPEHGDNVAVGDNLRE